MELRELQKLNDSVYEFYSHADFELEVVAFHGLCFSVKDLENAYTTTWQYEEEGERRCWLRNFIPSKSPKARILSVSYDSCAQVSDEAGIMSFSNLGRILVQDLIHLAKVGQRGCPVVLVGYCVGGLVLQQLCTEAEKQFDQAPDGSSKGRLDKFLTNVRAIMYLDTPRAGSILGKILRDEHNCDGPVLEYLNESSRSSSLGNLNREFDSLVIEREWERFICWYYHATTAWSSMTIRTSGVEVVTESSAKRDSDNFYSIAADHSGNAVNTAWSHLGRPWDELLERLKNIMKRMKSLAPVAPSKSFGTVKITAQSEEQVNDSLYVMYQPKTDVELELIFFPGSADDCAYKSTWMTQDDKDCWLQTWLPEAFPKARILAVSSYILCEEGEELDLCLTCENLIENIISYHQEPSWPPLILVGHCKGGLVVKELCNKVAEKLAQDNATHDNLQAFLRSVRGVAYYGTSHVGYGAEEKSAGGSSSGDISDRAVGRLNTGYMRFITEFGWKELALGETRPIQEGDRKHIIVDEFSASYGIQRNSFFPVAADHVSICRPRSPLSNNFLYLKHFIHTTVQEAQYRNMNVRRKKERGIAIIISMGDGMEDSRPGSEIDTRRFRDMADYIGFWPVPVVNETAERLPSTIHRILENEVGKEDECIICCVSAHGGISGGKQYIYDCQKQAIDLYSVILEPVTTFSLLAGKPKVFVINACRIFENDEDAKTGLLPDQFTQEPGIDDSLLMYSCCPGKEAYRRESGHEKGTLFVGEVANQVKWQYQTTDVQDIFEDVARRVPEVARKHAEEQFPMLHSSLRKRLSWRPR